MASIELAVIMLLAAAPGDTTAPTPEGPVAVLDSIRREREQLDAQRAEAEAAKKDLAIAESALDDKIKTLEALIAERSAVEQAIIKARKVLVDIRIKRLVEIAEKMPPQQAATYISGLDENVAASIVEGMSVRKAAMLISRLSPSKATKLSRIYLSREPDSEHADGGTDADKRPESEP